MNVIHFKNYLKSQEVKFHSMMHSPAFTSQEIAAAAHVSGKELAKTVIIKMDGRLAMMVLSANHQINFAKLKEEIGARSVDLASESEFKDKFPGCEVGAMPPLGNLYDMPVYVEDDLTHQDCIMFNGGSHSELIELSYRDFDRLVHPKVVEI